MTKNEQYQINLEEIENYKTQGTTITCKEKNILNEKKRTKCFFIQEKQKQIKKHIACLQNDMGKLLTLNSNILKECKNYFQTLYTKQNTYETTQNFLLIDILQKVTDIQNYTLAKEKNANKRNKRSNLQYGKWEISRCGWYT